MDKLTPVVSGHDLRDATPVPATDLSADNLAEAIASVLREDDQSTLEHRDHRSHSDSPEG